MTLTAGEVAALGQLVLPAGGYSDNARHLFLLACYTGLSLSSCWLARCAPALTRS